MVPMGSNLLVQKKTSSGHRKLFNAVKRLQVLFGMARKDSQGVFVRILNLKKSLAYVCGGRHLETQIQVYRQTKGRKTRIEAEKTHTFRQRRRDTSTQSETVLYRRLISYSAVDVDGRHLNISIVESMFLHRNSFSTLPFSSNFPSPEQNFSQPGKQQRTTAFGFRSSSIIK